MSSRRLLTLIEPGSCFAGTLLELVLAADRSYMLEGRLEGDNRAPASVRLGEVNFGTYPMPNGLTRLSSRFLGEPEALELARDLIGEPLDAAAAEGAGLVTFIPDDIDWADEIRLALEERASFSPDALSGMEASLALRRPRDDGEQDLRPALGLAELDLPAPQRHGRGGGAQALRHRPARRIR